MFYDERINAECGKIYRKGILLAIVITLIYVGSRSITLLIQESLQTILTYTEAVILLLGIGILLIGTIRFPKGGDERIAFERHRYYQKAGITYLLSVFGTYILTIPFTSEQMLGGQPHNHLLLLLEVMGYLYLFYAFKTKAIHFNYSFIDQNGARYYGQVLKRIGWLWSGLFIPFLIAAAWELVLHESFGGALVILFAYLSSAAGLSIEYFFLSWIEKLSYDSTDTKRFARGTRVAMLTLFVFELLSAFLQCLYIHWATGNLQDIPHKGAVIVTVATLQKRIGLLLLVLTGLVVCHLLSQIPKGTRLYAVCRIEMLLLALSALQETLMPLWFRVVSEDTLRYLSTYVDPWINLLSAVISVIVWYLFVRAMTTELGASKVLWFIPLLYTMLPLAKRLFLAQGKLRAATYAESIASIGCLVLLLVILWRYRGFSLKETTE